MIFSLFEIDESFRQQTKPLIAQHLIFELSLVSWTVC